MQAYISIGIRQMKTKELELQAISNALTSYNISVMLFANRYHFKADEERAMMEKAFYEINRSALLIAEASEKAVGVGVEVGYAAAKGIPIIYLRHEAAEHSTTLSGSSNYSL